MGKTRAGTQIKGEKTQVPAAVTRVQDIETGQQLMLDVKPGVWMGGEDVLWGTDFWQCFKQFHFLVVLSSHTPAEQLCIF